jgi:DNA-binding transcriptional regulator YiaG
MFMPKKLQELRNVVLKMTQRQMADELECSVEAVRSWETKGIEPGGRFVDQIYKMCSDKGLGLEKISIFGKDKD